MDHSADTVIVMPSGKSPRRVWAGPLAVALICATAPTSAVAARPSHGDLSPRLAELATPSVRSAPPGGQAGKLSLPAQGPGSLVREGNRLVVEVRFVKGAAAGVDDLRDTGVKVVNVSRRQQIVTVAAKPSELRQLSAVPRVASAGEVLAPIVYGPADPGAVTSAITPCFGAATSEGDEQLRAIEAREMFDVDGSGVTVGILSDSFDQDSAALTDAANDIVSGDLPGAGNPCEREDPVEVLKDTEAKGEDEGRAMAQIVHDLAPGAKLAFATAFPSESAFAENIEKLAKPPGEGGVGAQVIADDISYFQEPFFQEGPVGVAVGEVTAAGVAYFSSAGNNNLIGAGKDIASWEAPQFRLATGCPAGLSAVLAYVNQCMDFDPEALASDSTFGITVSQGAELSLDLQWSEPWNGVQTDIDAYLLDKDGDPILDEEGEVVRSEFANVTKTQRPFEFLFWENDTGAQQKVQVVVNRYTGLGGGGSATPRLKLALLQNGGGVTSTEYPESSEGDVVGPTIFGHNGAGDAMSVGAIRYTTNAVPEFFSSRGPVTHYFGPVEGNTPAAPLGSPQVLAKPDLVATDGGANTFFGSCVADSWRFFGTSASAPHAAAVAALEREALPAAGPAEVGEAQRESAAAVGTFPSGAVGAGMIDAVGAIEKLGLTPSGPAAPTPPPGPISCLVSEPEPETGPGPGQPPQVPGGPTEPPPTQRSVPNTFLLKHPPRVMRTLGHTAKAVFRFGASESGVTFLCRVDVESFHRCSSRLARRFELGRHVVRVKARNGDGNTDLTPAVYRFRVEKAERRG